MKCGRGRCWENKLVQLVEHSRGVVLNWEEKEQKISAVTEEVTEEGATNHIAGAGV